MSAAQRQPSSSSSSTSSRPSSYTWEQIKDVQSSIERCMQHYLTQTEIIATLQVQADVEPALTCLVWQKLEEQNPDFFVSYAACLRLKDQIVAFNYLVEQQTRLLQKLTLALPPSNGGVAHWPAGQQPPPQQQGANQQPVGAWEEHA
eukprot:CAMPEP_0198644516 /NCGR_PEP_ID=MMETSP1467-20131203/668_1 /TAXON_ID=1462469 /ORGANISM="unid. sp., Strain CCMP2135" /LENGTH=146 /DNA_ID=CAMNT_0044379973 /DNA_START=31 /DNA_END=471 /DNA_ORIENTATION=+